MIKNEKSIFNIYLVIIIKIDAHKSINRMGHRNAVLSNQNKENIRD